MSDEPTRNNPDETDIPHAPQQWERRPSKDLKQELSSAGSEDYEMQAQEGQADHLAGAGQSLGSKLAGGGMDEAEGEKGFSGTKLCPACNSVTSFSQGVCVNCQYRLGEEVHAAPGTAQSLAMSMQTGGKRMDVADAPAFTYAAPVSTGSGKRIGVIVVVVVVVVALAIAAWQMLKSDGDEGAAAPQVAGSVAEVESHPGGLSEVAIDDELRDKLSESLNAASDAWAAAGTDCYVYRFGLFSRLEAATSQSINVTAFCGGTEVEQGISDQLDVFNAAIKPLLDEIRSHAGVAALITPKIPNERDVPGREDVYLRYGYDYGLENFNQLEAIITGLEAYKSNQGQYPMSLSKSITQPPILTLGTYKFLAGGFGYLPIYRAGSDGNIIFGEGSWRESNTPVEVTSYYVFWFGKAQTDGLDFFSQANIKYLDDNYWFPYEVVDQIVNVDLTPDGKPDGIMCVLHDGELLRLE